MAVTLSEHCTFDTKFSDVAKFTALTAVLLQISCELSFLIVGFSISSLPTFALKSPNKYRTRKLIKKTPWFPVQAVRYVITRVLTWGVPIRHDNIAPATSSSYVRRRITPMNSTVVTDDMIVMY
jgi:hypothetical protein